jgi:signal transduction histidine kinase
VFILEEAIELITQSPGNLVYFLVTLFALQQTLFAVLNARASASNNVAVRRWIWASGGMLLGRIMLIVFGVLGIAGLLPALTILPSLERWVLLATVLGLGWAGVLSFQVRRWQTWTFLGLLVVSLIAFGYGAAIRSMSEQMLFLTDSFIWEQVGVAAALVLVLSLTVAFRPPEWEWTTGVLLFWGVGTVAQVVWGNPILLLDGWQRLASLVALPLMALLVQRQLFRAPPRSSESSSFTESVLLTEIVQSIESARDLQSTLILASSKLASLLHVDACSVALAIENTKEAVQVVAIHPPTSVQIDPPRLKLSDFPGLEVALTTREVVVANSVSGIPWLASLYAALGFEKPAPLVILPLSHKRDVLGLLLLGRAYGRQLWPDTEAHRESYEGLLLVAEKLAGAIAAAHAKKGEKDRRSQPAPVETGDRVADRQKLVETIEQAKKQVLALNGRIRVLIQEIKSRDEEILALNNELEARGQSASEAELTVWQEEVRQLAQERDALQLKVKDALRDCNVLMEERARLVDQFALVKQELEQVGEHRERLEEEVSRLQAHAKVSVVATADPLPAKTVAHAVAVSEEAETASAGRLGAPSNGVVGFIVADTRGQITMANALARQMLRLPSGNVIGVPLNGAYPDAAWTHAVSELLLPSDEQRRAHLSLIVDKGTIEADMAALYTPDGAVDGLIVTLHSSESMAEQREAVVSLASDLRTPMTSITGYTDLLLGEQGGILTEMQRQFLDRVRANVEQMNHMLNDLIQTVSPDSRRVELLHQPINLIEVIEAAIMGLGARFRERRLAVNLDLPSELSLIPADRDSLYQIMLRLLSNAVLCSKEGTQVVVSAREEMTSGNGRHLRISVADTGGGIAPEDYSRVFRRFYRAHQPLVEGMGETGIGMAVARALVEANGGRIWVETKTGEGSTISFLLPVSP